MYLEYLDDFLFEEPEIWEEDFEDALSDTEADSQVFRDIGWGVDEDYLDYDYNAYGDDFV